MNIKKISRNFFFTLLVVSFFITSQNTLVLADGDDQEQVRPEGWSEETHSNDVDPNYDIVFPDDEVNTITITIDPEDWDAMQENMNTLAGTSNTNQGGRGPGGRGQGNEAQDKGEFLSENPMWVSATIEFEGNIWTNVGVRYKGNSSLKSAWQSGSLKLPLKLDFDEFEDENPEIEDQRFYGFKQLSFANAFNDNSYMRDMLSSDIFEAVGLPVAQSAFYEIVLDYGDGPISLGLYTLNEVIDDTVIESYFGEDEGNIYEGDGTGASLSTSSYNFIEESFQKENNDEDQTWSDIEELYSILHADLRSSDPETWKDLLETTFNVDDFLKWLATSAVLQHWDTYGSMTHNFYLYHDPDTDQLNWITWDHNETFTIGGNTDNSFGKNNKSVSLDKSDITNDWPLITYLLNDAEYYDMYLAYMEEIISDVYNSDFLDQKIIAYAELIEPYVSAEIGANRFSEAVNELLYVIETQEEIVSAFLTSNK